MGSTKTPSHEPSQRVRRPQDMHPSLTRKVLLGSTSQVCCHNPILLYSSILIIATAEGALGGTAQKIGGPLSADGMVGKHFTEGGAIGGSVQQTLGSKEGSSIDHSK